MRATAVAVLFAAGAVFAPAQDTPPTFEAASVKLNTSGAGGSDTDDYTGRIVMTNMTLERLIETAYNVRPTQVSGPGWLEAVRVDIVAKYPTGTKPADRPLMLRTLLQERFKLVVHRESKDLPGYVLVVAKGGFKLKSVESDGNDTSHKGGRVQTLTAKGTSMAQLAELVSRYVGAAVADKTAIDGAYDFDLRWTNPEQNPDPASADSVPSLFEALEETLGLRLQAQKLPREIVVVDHVERVPTEN
jgi:uncharacterized protein (TIGR03435 family)